MHVQPMKDRVIVALQFAGIAVVTWAGLWELGLWQFFWSYFFD